MTERDLQLLYGELVSKCWEDEYFKKRFIEETFTVLKEAGIPVREGVEYRVVEAESEDRYIVLPDKNVAETVRELSKLLLTVSEQTDIIVPEGAKIVVLQNTETVNYIVLKKAPQVVSEVELDMIVGGKSKNAAKTINYGVAVNIGIAVNVNTAAAVTVAAGAAVTAGAAACVAVAGIVFI